MSDSLILNILLLSPLLSATLIFLLNISISGVKQYIYTSLALAGSGISALLALYLSYFSYFENQVFTSHLFTWLSIEDFIVEVALKADALSSFMILFIAPVSFLIHVYASGYMNKDKSYGRFFAYFNLFIFFMFLLVLADNPIIMFIGWEGVGLTSYALIGFYFEDIKNTYAGNKAFIANRVGDFGFLSALMLLFLEIGSGGMSFDAILSNIGQIEAPMLSLIAFLLFVGAMGKSAQIPLFVWLPDAMAGPTPVSALIHAATMVTAGVYMVARFAPLYNLTFDVSLFIAYIGAFSALFAAIVATRQFDIKKILAYSTMSQLGFMFMALGVGAYSTALFHMFTHAFFKALLFMGAGAIIVAFHHKQDIRELRGIKESMPALFVMILIATLTISAIPPLSAFFSKDAIMSALYASGHAPLFLMAFTASLLTVFYMFRLVFVVFYSNTKQVGEANSKSMLYPMTVLTIFSIFAGLLNMPEIFGGNLNMSNWLDIADKKFIVTHFDELMLMSINTLAIIGVIFYTYKRYAYTNTIDKESEHTLVANKFYIDEIYSAVVVKPLYALSILFDKHISNNLIDNTIHNLALYYEKLGLLFSGFENGNVRNYALYMLVGAVSGFIYLYVLLRAAL
ncbi:MAG: NADH-quinone oxidoreductase subunit L [Sulfurimonas sp.]|uniref:NADH-quinone oxidoreductase subunit L n=1 Tax=Sulfurimonas sp. TaxID=2022749 RepID=UPI00260256C1|nr:NADH-quinone oxidoreductase subunit L [Sulfurimonas sp.]MCW8895726.1 NADH-quinone oxidoreductase subunit L [Sulfurimonas sp.]MCW8953521.1 NADH-quinone oxidoreductase subunit L [Sulfurimonas sp.]MCW9068226.1 NADH-quinone oxidoreductase subunit L [Sulfurimonas sp.]